MIRVLHCIETISSGGVEQVRLTLVRGLDKSKFEHKIICTWEGGPVADALKAEGVELIPIGGFKHPFQWSKHKAVLEVIKTFKPHIIHGAIFEGMSMAAIGGKLGKVPVIILEETSDPQNRSKKANWLLRQYVRLADKIIAISPDVENYLISKAKIPIKNVKLVNNGITLPNHPTSEQIKDKRNELDLREDNIVVGFVGRLFNDHKRLTDLLEAVCLIKDSRIRVLVVGDGRDKKLVEDKIQSIGLSKQMILVGYQNDTSLYYSLMDIFTVPSAREGFGLVAAEAMLHKIPVIATRVGGLKDVVVDGETGFLVLPLSPVALAEKINSLIQNPGLRKTMGEKGYQRAMENYTAERYCREVENLYLSLLSRKGLVDSELGSQNSEF